MLVSVRGVAHDAKLDAKLESRPGVVRLLRRSRARPELDEGTGASVCAS